ncbi:hypothetical protein VOLCADRAFT_56661, partial [Volvox carteri f. nagariensis]
GFPLETHHVLTYDGYILNCFRIPYGRAGPGTAKRPPVLLIHGISLASTSWVVNGPDESLAFFLADRGYDVWLANTRGNIFSREHVRYSDKQTEFWNFALDEMAEIDLPVIIHYMKNVTGMPKVGIVGHSQGCTIPLMTLSSQTNLTDSVGVVISLGPSVFITNMKVGIPIAYSLIVNVSGGTWCGRQSGRASRGQASEG